MNIVRSIQRVHLIKNGEKKAFRRVLNVNEIVDYENYRTPIKWLPAQDIYEINFDRSVLLSSICQRRGLPKEDIIKEIERRKDVLHWMREKNIRSYKDVAEIIGEYYARPNLIYKKISAELEAIANTITKKS
jgi:flagellar protein FlaI